MISAIVLAAGESKRMGRQKMLLPYRGSTVIEHIVRQIAAAGIEETVVVVGHEGERIEDCLRACNVKVAANSLYQSGMLSSVRAGLDALSEDARSVMVLLGDQPLVQPEILRALVLRARESSKGIVAPSFQGRAGHPALLSLRYRDEIMQGFDEVGLRGLYAAHPDDVDWVMVEDGSVLEDMDTPEDYQRVLRQDGA